MSAVLFIPGPLPGLNELLGAAKSGRGRFNGYARLKKQWGDTVWALARSARLERVEAPVGITFCWREPNRRRDIDNISAAAKLVLDGLVTAGVLDGDGWKHVTSINHLFQVDAARPGVTVFIDPAPF
jgi:Holliday junction resolvase RusA-like endonuclease